MQFTSYLFKLSLCEIKSTQNLKFFYHYHKTNIIQFLTYIFFPLKMNANLSRYLEDLEAFSGEITFIRRQMMQTAESNKYADVIALVDRLMECYSKIIAFIRHRVMDKTIRPRRIGRVRRNAIDERPISPIYERIEE